jgi:transcriptional regulator with XRE-family HTH domain
MKVKLKIREKLDEIDMTIKELANKTGLNVRTVEDVIKRNAATIATLVKIKNAMNVTLDELVAADILEEDVPSKTIAELSAADIDNKYLEAERYYKDNNPALSIKIKKKRAPYKFEVSIQEANRYGLDGDRKGMLSMYLSAFFMLKVSCIGEVQESYINQFVCLCEEFEGADILDRFIEIITSNTFFNEKHDDEYMKKIEKFYASLTESLMKYGFDTQVENLHMR